MDAVDTLVTLRAYAERHEHGHRTVQRAISEGRIPGAEQDSRGHWWIPQDAPILDRAPAGTAVAPLRDPRHEVAAPDVRQAYAAGTPDVRLAQLAQALPVLVPLDAVAQALGTSVGAVRRLGEDGMLRIGRYGPRGALRVVVPPR